MKEKELKKYPKYKSSGIEWIGMIPEHWDIANVGRLNNLGRGRVISALDIGADIGDYPVYSSQTENNGIMGCINTYDFEGEYVTWTTDGANAGTVFYRDGKFNCTNVCGTIQPKNWKQIDLKFLPYFLNLGTKFSVRLDINPKLMNNMMAKIPLVIPPKPEQTAIANFLDDKTSQIDKLITNKQKLIGLLKEERTAVINQAVTRGINPNVKLKESGIEWLGKIPKHWEVKKLKYEMESFDNLRVPISADLRNGDKIYDYYGASGIIDKVPDYLFDGEYILIGEDGANLLTRSTELAFKATGKFWVNNHAHVLRPKTGNINYFVYLLEKIDYTIWVTGSAQPKLTAENLQNIYIWFPSLEEQTQIVRHIETETKRIDNTITKIEKEIELLAEYRTALISEVVTGKIKVT